MAVGIYTGLKVDFIAELTMQLARETNAPSAYCAENSSYYARDLTAPTGWILRDVMRASTYDTNQSGVVDDSEKLGGQLPAYYAKQADLASAQNSSSSAQTTANNAQSAASAAQAAASAAQAAASAAQATANGKESPLTFNAPLQRTGNTVSVTIPAQTPSDWNQANTNAVDYIKNKPVIPSVAVSSVNAKTGAVILTTADIADSLDKRYATDAQRTVLTNTSGTNTGDETAAGIKTKLGVVNLSGSNTGDETATSIGNLIAAAAAKTTPVDADSLALSDSAASNIVKKLTWANVKATLKTYFDTLYGAKQAYYNASGAIATPVKKWVGVVTPNTANGYSIDISSAGFSNVLSAQVICIKNTATANDCPQVSVKSYTNTALVVNITQGNTTLVSLLGTNVLGLLFPASVAGITLFVTVEGN